MAPVIIAKDLYKCYAGFSPVLRGVNIEVEAGELVAIMGPSGCGKSTMLHVLGMLHAPDSGTLEILGTNVLEFNREQTAAFRRGNMGFVMQSSNMFDHSTVFENVEFPLIYENVPPAERWERVIRALELVRLSARVHYRSNRLSGGEQQRVAIARAMVNNPRILLADEPTGALDARTSRVVMDNFRTLCHKGGVAMIMVTHDPKMAEFCDSVYTLEDGIAIAQELEDCIDLLHVSAGTYQRGFGDTHPSMFKAHGCNVYLAAEIKKHVSIPVATIGGLNDPAQMEEIIKSGKADVVYMARALLADPSLPEKVMANRDEEIVRCLRCFTCMAERAATATRRCTVNPLIGREMEGDYVLPAPEKKKVLVAGGGPGGLYAAWTAARRGHQVILCEKEDSLGGILRSDQALPFKYEMYQLAGTYAHLARKTGVEIRLNTEVTAEYVEREAPDALIIAVGSRPLLPPIPGRKGDNVVVVNNYYKEKDKVGEDVVVFGGGLAGCECAIHLGQEGKTVHIVEMRDALAPDANVRHRPLLLKEVEKYATVHTGCRGLEVRPDGIWCEDKEGRQFLVPGKSVIAALGQRSCSDIVEELQDGAPFVRIIGDAARVSTITNAVYWGYHAALDI